MKLELSLPAKPPHVAIPEILHWLGLGWRETEIGVLAGACRSLSLAGSGFLFQLNGVTILDDVDTELAVFLEIIRPELSRIRDGLPFSVDFFEPARVERFGFEPATPDMLRITAFRAGGASRADTAGVLAEETVERTALLSALAALLDSAVAFVELVDSTKEIAAPFRAWVDRTGRDLAPSRL